MDRLRARAKKIKKKQETRDKTQDKGVTKTCHFEPSREISFNH